MSEEWWMAELSGSVNPQVCRDLIVTALQGCSSTKANTVWATTHELQTSIISLKAALTALEESLGNPRLLKINIRHVDEWYLREPR